MGSRLRGDVRHLFECFCEISAPIGTLQNSVILTKYPESFREEELKTVPQFAFPCESQGNTVQHFSFVLTNLDSKWTFGFCRQAPHAQTALVLLSYLPWHELFYKILNEVAELLQEKDSADASKFLESLYNRPEVPDPGTTLHVPYGKTPRSFTCKCPNTYALPSIPESRNLTEYFNAVDSQNMMTIFASMLHERRIIMISSRLSRLTASIQAANAIIYPMNWQHIFIPVLPPHLLDYLLAPMPFLIGVPQSTWERVRRSELGEVVILDIDTNTIETPFNDLERLPLDIVSSMRRRLKTPGHMMGDGVARVFLRVLVQLIGGYRDALRFRQGEQITFCRDAFLQSRPATARPFLESMLQLQIFQQFVEERLEMLNSGQGFSDEFELEACLYSDKSSSKLKQQYKEWLSTMKKESGAILKQVKSKTNPAMRNAVKTMKEKSRTAYKDFRVKFKEMQISREMADNRKTSSALDFAVSSTDSGMDKPRSAPSSPKLSPITGVLNKRLQPRGASGGHALRRCETSVSQHYHNGGSSPAFADGHQQLDSASDSSCSDNESSSSEDDLRPAPMNMDLMGDLKDVIFKTTSSFAAAPPIPPAVDRSRKPSLSTPPVSPTRGEGCFPTVSSGVPLPLPPPRCRKRSSVTGPPLKHQASEEADLIHLDSNSPTVDEFDPLSKPAVSRADSGKLLSNPIYPYHVPNRNGSAVTTGYTSRFDMREDPFTSLLAFTRSNLGPAIESPAKPQPKPSWTTFE